MSGLSSGYSRRSSGAPLSVIGKADVQAFLTDASKQLAGESVRDLRGRLSGLFTCAEEWGWIKTGANPAKGRSGYLHGITSDRSG